MHKLTVGMPSDADQSRRVPNLRAIRAWEPTLIESHRTKAKRRSYLLGVGACVAMVMVAAVGIAVGPVNVPIRTVFAVLLDELGLVTSLEVSAIERQIVWDVRAPRVVLGSLVGAALATAGTVIQAVVRNPLGDPYLLGIVPGASLGAVAVIVGIGTGAASVSLGVAAFIGALGAFALTFVLGREHGRWPPARLVLAGVAVGYLLSSLTFFLQIRATPNQVQRVLFWSLGSVAGADWSDVALLAPIAVLSLGWLLLQGARLNALSAGDDLAAALGIAVGRFQLVLMACVALLTGVTVSLVGGIGFVGLMIPHIARLIVGADHRKVLVAGAFIGAVFMVLVDVAARMVLQPTELPISVVTAAAGAPFLLWLLRSDHGPSST